MSTLLDLDGMRIIQNLRKSMISDNVYKFKNYLINLHNRFESQKISFDAKLTFFQNSCILKTFYKLKDHVFKNLNEPSLYSLFSAFEDFLASIKSEGGIKQLFMLENQKINELIQILKDTKDNIIYMQIKMKNSRRNLKTKLRMQRNLNKIKEKVESLKNLKKEY